MVIELLGQNGKSMLSCHLFLLSLFWLLDWKKNCKRTSWIGSFLRSGWSIESDFAKSPSFWCISERLNWKFSSANFFQPFHHLRKYIEILPKFLHFVAFQSSRIEHFLRRWWNIELHFYQKSLILVHFRALELKIFFNHGEILNETSSRSLILVRSVVWYWKLSSTIVKYRI